MLKLSLLTSLLLVGCTDQAPPRDLGPAPVMTLLSAADITAQVGVEFEPVRVRLTEADGTVMSQELVSFEFVEPVPGGTLLDARLTNADGIAEFTFAPRRVGTFTVRAYFEVCLSGFKSCTESVVRAQLIVPGTATSGG